MQIAEEFHILPQQSGKRLHLELRRLAFQRIAATLHYARMQKVRTRHCDSKGKKREEP